MQLAGALELAFCILHFALTMNVPAQIGNYKLEREIGRGASSEVWLARHAHLTDHVVAVKVLMSQDREAIRRFQREAAIAARLHHPHIAQLFDYGYTQPFFYTIMEYVDGGSLRQIIERRRRIPLAEALTIFRQVADALDYAHALNVVHRDISPGNILVTQKSGRALLTDFGIARDTAAPITIARAIMGTPGYLSPEHAHSASSVTHLSDIFSLGVVFYEMLAGDLPWPEPPGLPEAPPFGPPIPLKERGVEGIPGDVDRVLRTLLAIDPTHRFASARAAVDELDRIFQRHAVATQVISASASSNGTQLQFQAGGVEPNAVEAILGPDLVRAPIDRAHRRADELRNPAAVTAILDAWAAQDRWRRRPLLGRMARLHKISSHNLYFYRLRVLYERRSPPETQEEPDQKAQVFPLEPELERWAVPLPPAKQFADEPGALVPIPGSTRVVICKNCAGRGTTVCARCGGKQRVYVSRAEAESSEGAKAKGRTGTARLSAEPAAEGGQRTATAEAKPEQVLVPCPACNGRGGVNCERCTGIGRLVQREMFRWSRQSAVLQAQDDLPALSDDWLTRNCASEVIYTQRQAGGLRPEWSLITTLDGLIAEAKATIDDNTRIAISELTVSFLPVTDVVFDLGKPGEGGLYKLAIYGFENRIPPDWRFFNWERVTFLCAIAFLLAVVAVLLGFVLAG
jgi:predicted Ser/Thr protein kinase